MECRMIEHYNRSDINWSSCEISNDIGVVSKQVRLPERI